MFIGISPEFTGFPQNFTRISPDFPQNIELEHLKKGDNHHSAFPHCTWDLFWPMLSLALCPQVPYSARGSAFREDGLWGDGGTGARAVRYHLDTSMMSQAHSGNVVVLTYWLSESGMHAEMASCANPVCGGHSDASIHPYIHEYFNANRHRRPRQHGRTTIRLVVASTTTESVAYTSVLHY